LCFLCDKAFVKILNTTLVKKRIGSLNRLCCFLLLFLICGVIGAGSMLCAAVVAAYHDQARVDDHEVLSDLVTKAAEGQEQALRELRNKLMSLPDQINTTEFYRILSSNVDALYKKRSLRRQFLKDMTR